MCEIILVNFSKDEVVRVLEQWAGMQNALFLGGWEVNLEISADDRALVASSIKKL